MKITLFTSNQSRHLHLINLLSQVGEEIFVVQECTTVFPGQVADFYNNSLLFQKYFANVLDAEKKIFGDVGFSRPIQVMPIKMEDISRVSMHALEPALNSDLYVVFGASYIKGELTQFLVKNRALNIHMGVSPFYRGASCNFWAVYDGNPELVGATVHLLSHGLDSGDMLFHVFPKVDIYDPFLIGMSSVRAAHIALIEKIKSGEIFDLKPKKQNKELEIRYSRNKDFNDSIIESYLSNFPTSSELENKILNRDLSSFYNPIIC